MKTIGVLTGGGDVPGLNTVIRDITYRASRERDTRVIGIKRGWGGLIFMNPSRRELDPNHAVMLTEQMVRRIDREGGTFLHTSRIQPSRVVRNSDLMEYRAIEFDKPTDMTPDVLSNLDTLGIDVVVAIGGDDTLSYALHLHHQGFPTIGIPKTMDGDVSGTDYCIGFSSAISKASNYITQLRTSMGSHERFGIVELFGRNSGFTALYTALAAKPDRVLIPEVPFDMDKLVNLLVEDRKNNPSDYSVVVVSEGATQLGRGKIYESLVEDGYGHKKLGGIGKILSDYITKKTNRLTISERLRYLLRSGAPDAKDKIVASAFANITFSAIQRGESGVMASLKDGRYCVVSLEEVANSPKKVDVNKFYNVDRYRPIFENFEGTSFML